MILSMTGYGKGEVEVDHGTVTAEIRTVNHRFLDFSIRIPRALNGYEREVERCVRKKLKRGHVYITITFDQTLESENFEINRDLLRAAYRMLTEFALREGIPGSVDINTLLSLPESFTSNTEALAPTKVWPGVRKALDISLERCFEMRRVEGAELERDIARHVAATEKVVARIERRAPAALKRSLVRVRKRLKHLLGDVSIDESRVAMETAIMAERTDFSEELVRLKSHLQQFTTVLRRGGEVSKKLTFLVQEIHREATTMGNKASDSSIIRDCLEIKEYMEKIREQVQNVE